LLTPRPTPKLEYHPSSAVFGCLFHLFTATLHIGGRSSIRNPRTRHALVAGTHIHGLRAALLSKIQKIRAVSPGSVRIWKRGTDQATTVQSAFYPTGRPL